VTWSTSRHLGFVKLFYPLYGFLLLRFAKPKTATISDLIFDNKKSIGMSDDDTFAVPGRLLPGAQTLAAPAMPPAAACASLPTRFPIQDGDTSARSAGFRSPGMMFALDGRGASGDAQVETSAQTLLALGAPGAELTYFEQDAVATVRKKRRVAGDGEIERTTEFASAEEDDVRGSGSDSGVEDGAMTTSSAKSDDMVEKPRKRPLRIRSHRKATHTVRKVRQRHPLFP
jgi:hypothetical protein